MCDYSYACKEKPVKRVKLGPLGYVKMCAKCLKFYNDQQRG